MIKGCRFGNILTGRVKNPNKISVYGVGFVGQGQYRISIGGKLTKSCNLWIRMLERAYEKKHKEKQPTYIGCSVFKQWLNFQNFACWVAENYNPETMQGWQLDKDILVKGNKVYSPETCCFVPREINTLFTLRQNKRGDYPIGVTKNLNTFQSNIVMYGKRAYLGGFTTPEKAFEKYKTTKEEYIKDVANKWKPQLTETVYEALIKYRVEITD